MSDTKNVKLGVCQVFYNGVDLGYTQGGVEVTVTTETHKVNVDQFGKTVIDEIIMSRNVEAKVPLAETTLENMVRIMPGASMIDTGGVKATGTVTFSTVPTANDTVTINGVVFTAKASAVAANEFSIGASVSSAAANLAAAAAAYPDPRTAVASYSTNLGVVTVSYNVSGTVGNAFTLAKSGASTTVSGAVLSGGVDSTKKKITVPTGISTSLLNIAKKLVLHPKAKGAADRSEDFVIPLAATAGALNFAYVVDKERIYNTTFMGYPDPSNDTLFVVGDESAA
jgi:hypothetical protein